MMPTRVPGDGVELDALVAGDGPLLILLHGFPETAACWIPQIEAFAASHRVVAPWQRGYRAGACPRGTVHYRIEHLCADVAAIADHFGAEEFALAGHDWGGIVAWWFAALNPHRVERLIAVAAPHPALLQHAFDTDPGQQAASAYVTGLLDPEFEARVLADGGRAFWDAVFGAHVAAGEMTAGDRAAMLADWQQPGVLTAMSDWYRAAPFGFPGAPPGPFARQPFPPLPVAVPTTVIWGDRDTVLLPALLDGLADRAADLTVHRVAAGHGILRERPAEVNRLMALALA